MTQQMCVCSDESERTKVSWEHSQHLGGNMRALIIIEGDPLEVLRMAVGLYERAESRRVQAEVIMDGPTGLPADAAILQDILLQDISVLELPSVTENALRHRSIDLVHQ